MKPGEVVPGDYKLVLESIDDNGSIKSVLKTDIITLRIVWQFTRDSSLPSMIEISNPNRAKIVHIDNIRSISPTASYNIYLKQRQGQELDWISISQGNPTQLNIKAAGIPAGDYNLTLESYNEDS